MRYKVIEICVELGNIGFDTEIKVKQLLKIITGKLVEVS